MKKTANEIKEKILKKFNSEDLKGEMIKMKTFANREIKIGEEYELREIWDGEFGDAMEILASGTVSPDEENVIAFEIVKTDSDPLFTVVKVTDIY